MIVGSNAVNVLSYLYNLIIGRLLGPASYGEVAALFSLIGLIGMIPFSLGLAIIKFISSAKTREEIDSSIKWLNKRILIFSVVIVALIIISSPFLGPFIKIDNNFLIVIISLSFLFSIGSFFYKSVLQGILKFKESVIATFVETFSKLVLSAALVYLGFGVMGAILGYIIATFIGWILSRFFVGDIRGNAIKKEPDIKPLLLFCIPILIQSFAMTSLYSTDLVLVKHYFSSHDTGIYAALSYLGRVIFFGCGPIASVMFPLVAQRQSQKKNYQKIFLYSLGGTALLGLCVLLVYWLFPSLAVSLLYGSLYLQASSLLIWFGISMFLYTLSTLLINFQLSLGNTKVVVFPSLAAIAQVLGITLFHSTLFVVIEVLILDNFLLLLSLGLFHLVVSPSSSKKVNTKENEQSPNFSSSSGL